MYTAILGAAALGLVVAGLVGLIDLYAHAQPAAGAAVVSAVPTRRRRPPAAVAATPAVS